MTRRVHALLIPALATLASLATASGGIAQDTTVVHPDSVTAEPDTLRPVLQHVVAVSAPAVPPGPLPPGTRYTFTRDSLLWTAGVTLTDLIATIPGVYVARAGFLGLPEYIQYAGRAGAGIQIFWDGLPLPALGADSLFHDLGRVNLTYLERIDVVVLPSGLSIYLVSKQYGGTQPRSFLRVMAGAFSTGAYAGLFQKRWPSGLGLDLAADFVGTEGSGGAARSDQTFDLWGRLKWIPSQRTGASYQVRRQSHDRDAVGDGVRERRGARTDYIFSMFAGTRDDGMGFRSEAILATSAWSSDSTAVDTLDQTVRQAQLKLRYMTPNWTVAATGMIGDARVLSGVDGRIGWVPIPGVVLAGDAYWHRHEGKRTSVGAHGAVGLYAGPFSVVGDIQFGNAVQAPAILADSAQRAVAQSIRTGFETRPLAGHVALVRRAAFLPLPYAELGVIDGFDSSTAATYVVADVKLQSSRALTLEAWYSTPTQGEAPNLQPPKHGRVQVTFRSKFWRTFRSGAFDLKVQVAMEYWSPGTAGLAGGNPVELEGAKYYEGFIQFEIGSFQGFWNLRNMLNSENPYIPGLTYPISVQTFGVKWEFSN